METGIFTAGVTGLYEFRFTTSCQACRMNVYKNGAFSFNFRPSNVASDSLYYTGNPYTTGEYSYIMQLNKYDTMKIRFRGGTFLYSDSTHPTSLSGKLI